MKHHFTTYRKKIPLLLVVGLVLLVPAGVAHANFFTEFLYTHIVQGFFGWIMGVGGIVLNFALQEYVVNYGVKFGQAPTGNIVNAAWATVRDIFNLTFIFGLVYIGFKMILRTDDGQSRRWLINLILAALLVNFSLFITKFVIDVSNILAVQIMNEDGGFGGFTDDADEINVSEKMAEAMNIPTVIDVENNQGGADVNMTVVMGTLMVYLVGTFVFFSAGILLIIRAVVLVVLMILSPFLFLGMVLPMFKGTSQKIWKALFSRAFLAPIYVLFLFITIQLANEFTSATGIAQGFQKPEGVTAEQFAQNTGEAFAPFILITALLILSLVAAQKIGAEGANASVRIGNRLRQGAQRRVAGYGARGVNRAAARYQKEYDRAGNTRFGRFARTAASVATLGALGDRGLSAAQNFNVKGQETAREKDKRKAAMQSRTNQQIKADDRRSTLRSKKADSNAQTAAIRKSSTDELVNNLKTIMANPALAAALTDSQMKALGESGKLSNDQMKRLGTIRNEGTFADQQNVLDNSGMIDQLSDATDKMGKIVNGLTDERLTSMDANDGDALADLTNADIAVHLSERQIEAITKSGNYSAKQIQEIKDARSAGLQNMAKEGVAKSNASYSKNPSVSVDAAKAGKSTNVDDYVIERRQKLMQGNIKDVGQLPPELFALPEMAPHIQPRALEERMRNGGVTNKQLEKIRDEISREIGTGTLAEVDQKTRVWRQWSERSTYGAQLGIDESVLNPYN